MAKTLRYLLNVSYIGTTFRGVQKQIMGQDRSVNDTTTIQGCIEIALKTMKPLNDPVVYLSSRTDAGVHAFQTTMHVDMVSSYDYNYEPRQITTHLNRYFNKSDCPIRILNTYIVPDTFHCRSNAISRTYMYRLTVCTQNEPILLRHIPIEENKRSLYTSAETFDVDKVRDAAKLFLGYHDFRTFMGKETRNKEKMTRRTIEMLNIEEVPLSCYSKYSWPFCINSDKSDYRSFRIYVKAPGFLYKQVRRTVATLIAVAQGKVTSRDIKFMIEVPSHRSWASNIKTVPAHGLYLCEVAYSKEDVDTFREHLEA